MTKTQTSASALVLLSEHTFCIRHSFFTHKYPSSIVHLSGIALYFPEQLSAESSQPWPETDAEQIFKETSSEKSNYNILQKSVFASQRTEYLFDTV